MIKYTTHLTKIVNEKTIRINWRNSCYLRLNVFIRAGVTKKSSQEWPPLIHLLQTCKPDSVSRVSGMAIIYLAAALLQQSCCLPFSIGRAALKR